MDVYFGNSILEVKKNCNTLTRYIFIFIYLKKNARLLKKTYSPLAKIAKKQYNKKLLEKCERVNKTAPQKVFQAQRKIVGLQ